MLKKVFLAAAASLILAGAAVAITPMSAIAGKRLPQGRQAGLPARS